MGLEMDANDPTVGAGIVAHSGGREGEREGGGRGKDYLEDEGVLSVPIIPVMSQSLVGYFLRG